MHSGTFDPIAMQATLAVNLRLMDEWRYRLPAAVRLHDSTAVEAFKSDFSKAVFAVVMARRHSHADSEDTPTATAARALTQTLACYEADIEDVLEEANTAEDVMQQLRKSVRQSRVFLSRDWDTFLAAGTPYSDLKTYQRDVEAERERADNHDHFLATASDAIDRLGRGYARNCTDVYQSRLDDLQARADDVKQSLARVHMRCLDAQHDKTSSIREAIKVDTAKLPGWVRRDLVAGACTGFGLSLTEKTFYAKLSLPPLADRQSAKTTAFDVATAQDTSEDDVDNFVLEYLSKQGYDYVAGERLPQTVAALLLYEMLAVVAEESSVATIIQISEATFEFECEVNKTPTVRLLYCDEPLATVPLTGTQRLDTVRARLLAKVLLTKTPFLKRVLGPREGFVHAKELVQLNCVYKCALLTDGARKLVVRCTDLAHVVHRHCGHPDLQTSMARLPGERDSLQVLHSFFYYTDNELSPNENISQHILNMWIKLPQSPEVDNSIVVFDSPIGVDCGGKPSKRAILVLDRRFKRDPCFCQNPVNEDATDLRRLKTCYPIPRSFSR